MAENTETSFLEEKKTQKIHVKDILFTILRNLHWLVICGAVGAAIAGYQVRGQNKVYSSSARILIVKTSTSSSSEEQTLREASVKNMFYRSPLYNSNVNNEMQIFSSKSTNSFSIRFCSAVSASSVLQYCAKVCPSILVVL